MRSIYLYREGGGGIPPGWRPEGVELEADISAAEWVAEGILDWRTMRTSGCLVGHIVPGGFASYARLFHPASYYQRHTREWQRVRWAEIAAWEGTTVHPLMQFHRIAKLPESKINSQPEWGHEPCGGSLPPEEVAVLAGLLPEFTTSPAVCYFCIWEGWGDLDHEFYQRSPRASVGRDCLLFRGPLSAVTIRERRPQSPTVWWPADRAWCVATEIDFTETLIGGSAACIEAVLNHPELEALPITLDARLDSRGDTINPPIAEE